MEKPKRRFFENAISYWKEDRSLSLLLFSLLITVFIIFPLSNNQNEWRKLLVVFISINFITGIFSFTKNRVKRFIGIVLTLLILILGLSNADKSFPIKIFELSLWIFYFTVLAMMIIRRIFSDDNINYQRILGAIAVYIIFGMIFSFIYLLIYLINPMAFLINERLLESANRSDNNFLYFSFVTLCTLGYGDMSPLSNIAQSVSILEALTGILFPGILIARLVGLSGFKNSK